jgi:peroxiredoxin
LSILKQTFADSLKHIIRSEDGNLMAFLIMEEHLDFETHIDFYKEQLPVFEQNLGDHWYFKQVNQQFQDIKKLALGSIAPDFTLPDSTGQPISLSSFRGKYLFLDFWASWCQPCRRDNPRYLSIYNEFSNDNFEILGVSFDRKRENWLKAIENDGLKWAHVSDLQYFDSEMIELYNITNVPTTFLLDPDGKIIAKNIHPEELKKILFEIL